MSFHDNTHVVVATDEDYREGVVNDAVKALATKLFDESVTSLPKEDVVRALANRKVEERSAFFHKLWLNNGHLNPRDASYMSSSDRENRRIKFDEMVDMMNQSAAGIKSSAEDEGVALSDSLWPHNASILMPQIVSNVMRMAAEPMLVGTRLMRKIQFSAGETITFPAAGAFDAEDMAPGQEYPEKSLDFSGMVTAKLGKTGVKVRIVEELIRYSMFDVMSLHIQAAGRAMARLKEVKAWNLINDEGSVAFDNDSPSLSTASLHGRTSGRNFAGLFNNTFMLEDLFVMFADLMNAGYVPNTLCVNPMGWLIFARNPEMRALAYQIGNGSMLWQRPEGAPGQAPTFGPMYTAGGNTPSTTPTEQVTGTMYTPPPSFFPVPFTMEVSPFVEYDATNQTTSIIMCDRDRLGFLIQDEEINAASWDEPSRDVMNTRLRERYTFALDSEGEAVIQAKAISLSKGYDIDANASWQQGTGDKPTGTA